MLAERVQIDLSSHIAAGVFHFTVVRAFAEVDFLVVLPVIGVGRRSRSRRHLLVRAGVPFAGVMAVVRAAMVVQRDQLIVRHQMGRIDLEHGLKLFGGHPFVNLGQDVCAFWSIVYHKQHCNTITVGCMINFWRKALIVFFMRNVT